MSTRTRAAVAAPLILVGLLAVGACGGSSASGAGAGTASSRPAGGTTTTAAAANGAAAGTSDSSCTGGLTAAYPGVVDIFCGGPADIKVTAGSLTKDFTGGSCRQGGGVWSATAGVVTEYGVYKGKPVDVVSVNNQAAAGKGTIQLTVSGHSWFADSASFAMESGGSGAHLSGTAQSLPEGPDTPVTVDVTC